MSRKNWKLILRILNPEKNNMKLTFVFFLVAGMLTFQNGFSQEDTDLRKEEQHIRGDYNPEVNEPVRIDALPEIKDTLSVKIPVVYNPVEFQIPVNYEIDTIQAAVIKREPVEKIYRNFVKAGFGTYTTPMLEFRHGSGRTRDGRYGIFVRHLSSKGTIADVAYPGFSENTIDLFGERFFPDHTLLGRFRYDRDVVHYYGFNPELFPVTRDQIRQRFNKFEFETRFKRNELDSALEYNAGINFKRIADVYDASETYLKFNAQVFQYLDKEKFGGDLEVELFNNHTAYDTAFAGIARIEPKIITRSKNWFIRAGLNMAIQFHSDEVGTVHFFPDAELSFNVIDNIIVPYAGIKGGVRRNSFWAMAEENPFFYSYAEQNNVIEKWNVFGGIKGALSNRTSFNTMASFGEYEDMLFWVNDVSNMQNTFLPLYANTSVLKIHGELGYTVTEKLHLLGSADYFKYTMEAEENQPWHKPTFKANLSTRYSLFRKIIATAEIFYLGERMARNTIEDPISETKMFSEVKLDDVIDFNLGIEYRYTKRMSGFLKFHNILASKYYPWYQYPAQRFQLLGGVTLSF